MLKKFRLYIISALFILVMFSCFGVVLAAEPETEHMETEYKETVQTEIRRGWNTIDGYQYFYTPRKKMVTGWRVIRGKYYYFRKTDSAAGPKGSMVTGFLVRKGKTFYFSQTGVMQTGWVRIDGELYYFARKGGRDYRGVMHTGLKKINGKRFYFGEAGNIQTGFHKINGKTYYFDTNTQVGLHGKAVTGWNTIGEYTYYFNKNGVLQKNKWISQKYYVDKQGRLLKKTVTPDGYFVNKYGIKTGLANGWKKIDGKQYYYKEGQKLTGWQEISGKKYYLGEDGVKQKGFITVDGERYYLKKGVMQTGWATISKNKYYFDSEGKMLRSTVVNGIYIGADGVADMSSKVPAVLIIAGHGMGDVGAKGVYETGTLYEYEYTRQFANLIKAKLETSGAKLSVTMYDQNYDLYQIHAGKKTGPVPDLTAYDYVLEIHFNATVESLKDVKGDGAFKGVGMYINSARTRVKLDKAIVSAIASTGFRVWGGGNGIFKSATLLNARTCQEKGVPYGLLETAFIDDKDDMNFYHQNKVQMAHAAANAIIKYFDDLY